MYRSAKLCGEEYLAEIEALIAVGRALEQPGSEQQAVDYFVSLARQYPDDAVVQFETLVFINLPTLFPFQCRY